LRDVYPNYQYDYDPDNIDRTIRDESLKIIQAQTDRITEIYPDEVNEDVYTEVCDYKFLYSVITYGIVAILALIHVFRKIHTAFIWPTLSTLVTFNVLLKSVNFAMRYVYCIVGGLAWEGFNFYQGYRTKVEQDYIFAVSIVYRKFQQDSDTDIDP